MLSNLIYLQNSTSGNFCVTWGISAGDFVNGISEIPQNIIILNDDISRSNGYNLHTKFATITGSTQVKEYIIGEHKNLLHNNWVDYQTKDGLDSLSDDEIADLLYFAHMRVPRHRRNPFSVKLGNQIVYLGGNNGFKRIYFKNFAELDHILELSIKRRLRGQLNSKRIFFRPILVKEVDNQIINSLLQLSSRGLLIAFELGKENNRRFTIPLFTLKDELQQKVIWDSEVQLRENTNDAGKLIYNTLSNKWSLSLKKQTENDLNDLV